MRSSMWCSVILTINAMTAWMLAPAAYVDESSAFLQDIIHFYGGNGSLSAESLTHLLTPLDYNRETTDVEEQLQSQCLSATDILFLYGLGNQSQFTEQHLEMMCPALLSHVVLPNCPTVGLSATLNQNIWGYGFLAVTIINLSSLLGLVLVPITSKPYFPKVLTYFIGLAIGTLFSNAVLQLIPEALGLDPTVDDYVFNAMGIFGGFYLLLVIERLLKMILKNDEEFGHSHFSPAESQGSVNTYGTTEEVTVTNIYSITDSVASPASQVPPPQEVPVPRSCCWCLRLEALTNIRTMAWMISLSDAVHNLIDGLAIGASFTVSMLAGFSTSLAVVCEEFPHELGDFVILLNAGMTIPQAVFFNLLSSMSCYLGLALGILAGSNFAPNIIFAFAGGMFLYISLADMLPEMDGIIKEQEKGTRINVLFFLIQNAGILTGFAIILLITLFAGDINLG